MRHLYYESLRRRLNQQENFPLLEEKIQRAESGIYGEMLVERELADMNLQHFDWITNFQYLSSQNTSYQMDFILILPHCLLILEVKNITGAVRYIPHSHEFQRVKSTGEIDSFRNPFDQAFRHQQLLEWLLKKSNMTLPVFYAVIMTNPNCTIDISLKDYPILHLSYLRRYLNQLSSTTAEKTNSQRIKKLLLKHSQMLPPPKLVQASELIRGIICIKCNGQMTYSHGISNCPNCGHKTRLGIHETIRDSYLLIGDQITNEKLRWFSLIDSKFTASKILSRLRFERRGSSVATTYTIPPQFVYTYNDIDAWKKKDG